MTAANMSQLATVHQGPPPGYTAPGPDQDAVLIRYDGHSLGGAPIVYAQISLDDAARIPEKIFSHLDLSEDDIEHGFFMQARDDTTYVFIDTERHEKFLDRAIDALESAGVTCQSAVGDLRAMRDAEGDIYPPACPAFVENGMQFVDLEVGFERMAEARRRRLETNSADFPSL